jgi:hypothetical protein
MHCAAHACLKAAVGTACLDSPALTTPAAASRAPPPPRPSRRRPDRLASHAARLANRATIPTELPSRPPRSEAADAVRRCAARCSPVDVTRRRRPRAGEPPVPLPSPVRQRRAAIGSLSSAATARSHRARRVARAGRGRGPRMRVAPAPRTRAAPRVTVGHAPAWQRAAPVLCDWVERGFDPVTPGLNFIFSKYIQFIATSKICVGFI